MVEKYIPEQGDLVWIDFDPQIGREQAGRRPALILSPAFYNRIGLALMCPITSREKGYPFEVKVQSIKIKGVILADQVKSIDWQERNIRYIDKVSKEVLIEVKQKIKKLIGA